MTAMLQKLRFKLRYWRRVAILLVGLCPRCYSRVNWMPSGRHHCPSCG